MPEQNNHIPKLTVFLNLTKYKLSLAVAFSATTGYFLCSNNISPDFFSLIPGVFLLTAGSAVLNQVTERKQDSMMERTRERPVASGKITCNLAIIVLTTLLFTGSFLLLLTGLIPFALGIVGVVLYNLIYTPLKKVTFLSIIPGALVGAIPPLIGFTSSCGASLNNKILLFSSFMFLWQIPHFWLLLLRYGKEYQAAGFRTIYDFLTEKQIKIMIFFWVFLSAACLNTLYLISDRPGIGFPSVMIILTVIFLLLFIKYLLNSEGNQDRGHAFIIFNTYSFALMIILIADSVFGSI